METTELASKIGRIISPELEALLLETDRLISENLPDLTRATLIFHLIREIDTIVTERAQNTAIEISKKEDDYTVKAQNESETTVAPERKTETVASLVEKDKATMDYEDCDVEGCSVKKISKNQLKFSYIRHALSLDLPQSKLKSEVYGKKGFHKYAHIQKPNGVPILMDIGEVKKIYELWKAIVIGPILVALEDRFSDSLDSIDKLTS